MIRATLCLSLLLICSVIAVGWYATPLVNGAGAAEGDGREDHGHDDHAGHDDHDEGVVRIAPGVMREFGIEVEQARGGQIGQAIELAGEVVFNADRIAHVTPTVTGIVRRVNVSAGDHVKQGQVMAVLISRELAAARSDYLAAAARLELAGENLDRDERLFESKIGTQRALLESRQSVREGQIVLNQAEAALHALGYSHDQIVKVATLEDTHFSAYELMAPLGGVVTRRHLTIGEVVGPSSEEAPFVIADLATVWVNLSVYQRDLAFVEAGQSVRMRFAHGIPETEGKIAFVTPSLEQTTRTATARIVLDNPKAHWRPGMFVTGRIETGHEAAFVVVPRSAISEVDDRIVVFVQTDEGFEPRPVTLGESDEARVEITQGLKPGERYVSRNTLALKAQLNRAALEHAGHAH